VNLGPSGLGLTATSLRAIADGLDDLAAASVRVDHFVAHGYRVTLHRHEDQRDGAWYEVVGLTREEQP
jgi:hypothetical protein